MQGVYQNARSMAKHDLRSAQNQTIAQLRDTQRGYQLDSALCYWNTIQYYGLCPLLPSAMVDYGFAFGSDTEESYVERLKESDCFLIKKNDLEDIREMEFFSTMLSEQFQLLDREYADGTKVFVKIR